MKDAKFRDSVLLDYTVDSIERVEFVLAKIHEQYVENPGTISVNGLATADGAYLGEVIRRNRRDAKWERDDPAFGEKAYPLIYDGRRAYAVAWCLKRITNGAEHNVWHKAKIFLFAVSETLEGATKRP